jgi:hypothetical protein
MDDLQLFITCSALEDKRAMYQKRLDIAKHDEVPDEKYISQLKIILHAIDGAIDEITK